MKPTLQTTKSILAKLLATENFNVEHGNYEIPAFDVENRILYLPIWPDMSENLYDLFVSHEVSHALHTPNDGWHSNISEKGPGYKSFLNVIEDARIEKLIKRKYPGLKMPMRRGYNELIAKDFFGIESMDIDELPFIDRINIFTKSGWLDEIFFTDEEHELLQEVRDCETFEEVLIVTDKIYEYSKDKESLTDSFIEFIRDSNGQKEQFLEQVKQKSNESNDETEGDKNKIHTEQSSMNNDASSMSDDEQQTSSQSSDNIENDDEDKPDKNVGGKQGGWGPESPHSITDKNFRENEKKLLETHSYKEVDYTYIPNLNSNDFVTGHKDIFKNLKEHFCLHENHVPGFEEKMRDEFNTFMKENVKVVNYLVKEFEMKKKASLYLRAKTSKTGVVESSSIFKYKFSDNIFKKVTTIPEGKNHGLVMLLDWSGSMSTSIHSTIQQTIILAMFCRKANIEFDVLSFHDTDLSYEKSYFYGLEKYAVLDYQYKDHILSKVNLRQLLSSEMSKREFLQMAYYLNIMGYLFDNFYYGVDIHESWKLCGTPLDSSLLVMFDYIKKFKEIKKVDIVNLVVLTDGESNTEKLHYVGVCADAPPYLHGNQKELLSKFQNYRYKKVYLSDRLTKSSYELKNNWYETDAILNLLRDRLNINIVNFYICNRSEVKYLIRTGKVDIDYDDLKTELNKNGSTVTESSGWDELYLILKNKLDIDDTNHLQSLDDNATKAQLKRAFAKNNNKLKNRVVLQRFIEMIS